MFQKRKRTFPGPTNVPNIPSARDEEEELENGVLLRRFAHQVAGRSPMYCFDNNETVCKPLNMREAEFYNSRGFPKRLERFTPRYHGSTVAVCHGSDVIAIDQAVTGQSSGALSGRNRNPPESESGSSCSDEDDEELNSEEEAMREELSPWSAKIHQKETLQQKIELIMLENVTANQSKPCILDLKVGTCLWYPHDSYRKRRNHEQKVKSTTSKSLGLRLHGLQIYDSTHDKYHYRDKFHGRKLTVEQLVETVQRFLHSADRRLWDGICAALITRLTQLRNMIDFAKATYAGFLHGDENYTGPDEGYLYGLNHLINIIQKTIKSNAHVQ